MRLSPEQSRAAALALAMLLVAAFVLAVALPIWRFYQGNQDTLAERRDQIERFERIASRAGALAGEVESLKARRAAERYARPEASGALAAAELQELVKQVAGGVGAQVISTQALEPDDEGPLGEVGINARINASVPAAQAILHDLEGRVPLLLVESVEILSSNRSRRTRRTRRSTQARAGLELRFRLSTFVAGGVADAGRGATAGGTQ